MQIRKKIVDSIIYEKIKRIWKKIKIMKKINEK